MSSQTLRARRFPHRPLILGALLAVASTPALAGGDADRGKTKSVPCQACHGVDGNSENPTFPRLAGQYASYIEHALLAYTTGERKNAIMQGFAATLSKQDRADLAAYYASQDGVKVVEGQR